VGPLYACLIRILLKGKSMTKQKRIEGIPYAEVKEKALQNKAVIAAYEKAKKDG
jgi:hypothetical protein